MVGGIRMEIYHVDIHQKIEQKKPITACIGYFDGLHKGHQALINKVLQQAKQTNTVPAVITFDPDPWSILHQMKSISHITSMNDRMQLAQEMGIQLWIIIHFHEELAHLSAKCFHQEILNPLQVQTLICGHDFHYANKGEGNIATLKDQSKFKVIVVDEVCIQEEKVRSSFIEKLIIDGEVEHVERLLGRFYCMKGKVFKGRQIGRKIGFPTANLLLNYPYIYPKNGVYIGSVYVKEHQYMAIINIGNNPTLNYRQDISIEAHILDFSADIYDEEIIFYFHKRLRGEQKFINQEALVQQLQKDTKMARNYFEER